MQFKEFVNVLATIRQEDNGEKYLVLKSKFYPANVSYSQPPEPQWPASPSSYEPSMLPPPPPIPSMGTPEATGLPVFRAPPPYRPPPEPLLPAAAQQRRSIESMPPPPPPPVMARQSSFPTDDFIPASAYLLPTLQQQQQKQSQPPPAERAVSVQDLTSTTPAVPPRRLKSQHSADDKENFSAVYTYISLYTTFQMMMINWASISPLLLLASLPLQAEGSLNGWIEREREREEM